MPNETDRRIPVDADTARLARTLRAAMLTPDASDLCAGADITTEAAERVYTQVVALRDRLGGLIAKGQPVRRSRSEAPVTFVFDVLDGAGNTISAVTITGRHSSGDDSLRAAAANYLIENSDLYADGAHLSHEPPRAFPPNQV